MRDESRPLADAQEVRNALSLLHSTVAEDRRQIAVRIGFAIALVAFTFSDLGLPSGGISLHMLVLLIASFASLLAGAALYLAYYQGTIAVMYELARRSAYANPDRSDLDLPREYWARNRRWWHAGSAAFILGCALYALVLALSLVGKGTLAAPGE